MTTKKRKTDIKLDKRKYSTAALSKLMPSIMNTLGRSGDAKKSITMTRVINHWSELVGQDIALRSSPLKIIYKKQKCKETGELKTFSNLRIRCEGALGTMLAMRGEIITQRLNRLFGASYFSGIQIEHGTVGSAPHIKRKKPEPKHYDLDLSYIDDPVLKSRLESLGQAVMNSAHNK